MRFSPYRDANHTEPDWELIEEADYVYDSDDSEDWEFPVHEESVSEAWSHYDLETKSAVTDAVELKSLQVCRVDTLIDTWSSNRKQRADSESERDFIHVNELLKSINLEHDLEDKLRKEAFELKNRTLLDTVEQTIAGELERTEETARIAKQLEADRLRKLAEEQEKKDRIAENERRQKNEELQRQQKQEADKREAERKKLAAEAAEKRSKDEASKLAQEREKVLGTTPQADALAWNDLLERFKVDVLKPVSESKDLKNFCHKARLKINPRVGQVTNSLEQIGQVSKSLKALFDEASKVDSENLAQRWCLNFFCKAIVKQAEGEVMVKPTACYPLAFLAISLMKQYPELQNLYLSRIAKKCPWTIPYIQYDKDTESGRKCLGWKRKGDNKYEETTAYLERQEGIFRLWAATASLNLKASPFPIENTWKFVSRLLNSKIEDDELRNVSFAIVSSFLDIAGKTFLKTYGNQARKIVQAIAHWVGPDFRGANASRLRILVEAYVAQGQIGLDFEFER